MKAVVDVAFHKTIKQSNHAQQMPPMLFGLLLL